MYLPNPFIPKYFLYTTSWVNPKTGEVNSSTDYVFEPAWLTRITHLAKKMRTSDIEYFKTTLSDLKSHGAIIIEDRLPPFKNKIRSRIGLTEDTTWELQRRPLKESMLEKRSNSSLKTGS